MFKGLLLYRYNTARHHAIALPSGKRAAKLIYISHRVLWWKAGFLAHAVMEDSDDGRSAGLYRT